MKIPKVFISYSWSSASHCDCIRSYAERLINDGVDVIFDQWSLTEGQDKYAFMEKMVTDSKVTHVLIFSDDQYTEKADGRKAGVGTESQIISKEVYDKVDQKKFIPIICQKDENGEPRLPVFLRSRIWIDFSTPEAVNENWEKLLRVLYGKPIHEKPSLGKPPLFLNDTEVRPSLPTIGKFNTLRDALLNTKPTIEFCRRDFIDTVIGFIDSLRIHKNPNVEHRDEKVLDDLHKLLPVRDQLIDWLILESSFAQVPRFDNMLVEFLERILALKCRPEDATQWERWWFDSQRIFVYELFLYIVAILIKGDRFESLRNIFTTHFLLPESEINGDYNFVSYDHFHGYSEALEYRNKRLKLNRISIVADIVKERATRRDIPFRGVMQADLVVVLISLLSNDCRWYPNTLAYAERVVKFPLFVRAAQHKYFERLKLITGINTGDMLRKKFAEGYTKHNVRSWHMMFTVFISLSDLMNMKALDTID
ncbi:MAG: TIR domain-containing protein [Candidatus Zapsychrus exili]|nr:TIR domain-containing protein [Candidatus Zapsychrus exili]